MRKHAFAIVVGLLIGGVAAHPAAAQGSLRDEIGWNAANERLGRAMPTGAGMPFGHIEGNAGEYAPELTGPAYEAVAFSLRSGPSKPSGHTTATARIIYGSQALAPGVEVVHLMTSQDFLTAGLLRANTTAPPMSAEEEPTPFPARVYTHSWISNPGEAQALPILRRVDWLIDRRDIVMVVGVNNGRDTPIPSLLSSAYNTIAVGQRAGNNSGGTTTVEVPGRMKPELIAPGNLTSFSTPVVAAAAGLLLEYADRKVADGVEVANRSELIKAALIGGARKSRHWEAAEGRSLDDHRGAGMVNVDRSLSILDGGPTDPGAITQAAGWAYLDLQRGENAAFTLEPAGELGRVTVTAVWNRRIDGRIAQLRNKETGKRVLAWLDGPRVSDFDLRLVRVGTDVEEEVIAASESRVDNVEHLYLPTLAAGSYRIDLTRQAEDGAADETYEVALTWIIDPVKAEDEPEPEPEPEVTPEVETETTTPDQPAP